MTARRQAQSAVAVVASAFLGYWLLLVYCEVVRPVAPGLSLGFDDGLPQVVAVAPDSPAGAAGLLPGDRLLSVNGYAMSGRLDMLAMIVNFAIDRPQQLVIQHGGAIRPIQLTLAKAGWDSWRRQGGPAILALRIIQLGTLLLAIAVALARPQDVTALVGAVFLATTGVFSVTLPYQFAVAWRELPAPVGLLLCLPFACTTLIGAWLFSFFAVFPETRLRPRATWLLFWLPIMPAAASCSLWVYAAVVHGRPSPQYAFWPTALVVMNAVYVVAGLAAVIRHARRSTDPNHRRRIRVLLIGALVGSLGGVPVVAAYWRTAAENINGSFLQTPAFAAGAVLFFMMPLSFAYAILRHRLFGLGLMIRQGVRYALARRALSAPVPIAAGVLLLDLLAHGHDAVGDVLRTRAWMYGGLVGLTVLAGYQRKHWLLVVDRRFFRERYNAQAVLRQLASDVRQASSVEIVAATIVHRVEATLHPAFAALLLLDTATGDYTTRAVFPATFLSERLGGSNPVLAVAALLDAPMEISATGNRWFGRPLAIDALEMLRAKGIELIVPILTADRSAAGFLVLGRKRSEEPYSDDDGDLLMAVAESIAQRTAGPVTNEPAHFEECKVCGACYDTGTSQCRFDQARLVPVGAPRVIGGRYRTEWRIGRGGMGTVYSATDITLERRVAVKIVRPELMGAPGAAQRFQREARAVAAFTHPNVVTVHDFGLDGTTAFLVMEVLDGRTLHDAISMDAPMPPPAVLRILRDVVAAVDAAHRLRFVHRDLKPENIYLEVRDGAETAKVLDFGIVKLLEADDLHSTHTGATTALIGTPRYMAPEQLRGERPAVSWDVWALAVMTFEMLTGVHPFAGTSPMAVDGSMRSLLPRLQPAFFERALAVDPLKRPSSASHFLREFEDSVIAVG